VVWHFPVLYFPILLPFSLSHAPKHIRQTRLITLFCQSWDINKVLPKWWQSVMLNEAKCEAEAKHLKPRPRPCRIQSFCLVMRLRPKWGKSGLEASIYLVIILKFLSCNMMWGWLCFFFPLVSDATFSSFHHMVIKLFLLLGLAAEYRSRRWVWSTVVPPPSEIYDTHWQTKLTAPETISRSRDMVGAHQNLNASRCQAKCFFSNSMTIHQ